jgi:hypothetical protein
MGSHKSVILGSPTPSGGTGPSSAQFPATLGQLPAGDSFSVVEASGQEWLLEKSTELEASHIIKASAGTLRSATIRLDSTAPTNTYYIQLYNSTTVPADTAAQFVGMKVQHSSGIDDRIIFDMAEKGVRFTTGIVVAVSTTPFVKTISGSYIDLEGAEYK